MSKVEDYFHTNTFAILEALEQRSTVETTDVPNETGSEGPGVPSG